MFSKPLTSERKYRLTIGRVNPTTCSVRAASHFSTSVSLTAAPRGVPTVRNLSYRTLCPARPGPTAATPGTLFLRAAIRVGDLSPRNTVQPLLLADEGGHRLRHNAHGRRGRRSGQLSGGLVRRSRHLAVDHRRQRSAASCASVWTPPPSVTTRAGRRCGRSNVCSTTRGPRRRSSSRGASYRLADLLAGFLAQLKSDLQHRSNIELPRGRAQSKPRSACRPTRPARSAS